MASKLRLHFYFDDKGIRKEYFTKPSYKAKVGVQEFLNLFPNAKNTSYGFEMLRKRRSR